MATITRKWGCDACGLTHDTRLSAAECCIPDPVELFVCSCGEEHLTEEHARSCCGADPDEPIRVTRAELEAAGQQRLDF